MLFVFRFDGKKLGGDGIVGSQVLTGGQCSSSGGGWQVGPVGGSEVRSKGQCPSRGRGKRRNFQCPARGFICGDCGPPSELDAVVGPGHKCPTCKGKWTKKTVCFLEFFVFWEMCFWFF